ncbi:hypothetical protein ATSB10_25490 [Dyella thiooxydans]|uniref:Uncharacterized protein n=1 Tax=Dyella thiooxydans TaxID=445710 RepID=A0A160N290_9GAMM|nr:hypothetical protein ATSB10_25490 [Dyella thiooxydans]
MAQGHRRLRNMDRRTSAKALASARKVNCYIVSHRQWH